MRFNEPWFRFYVLTFDPYEFLRDVIVFSFIFLIYLGIFDLENYRLLSTRVDLSIDIPGVWLFPIFLTASASKSKLPLSVPIYCVAGAHVRREEIRHVGGLVSNMLPNATYVQSVFAAGGMS